MKPVDEKIANPQSGVVTVKKQIIFVLCIAGVLLALFLLVNIVHTFHAFKNPPASTQIKAPVVAGSIDTDWYKTAQIQKKQPVISQPAIITPAPALNESVATGKKAAVIDDGETDQEINEEKEESLSKINTQNAVLDEQRLKDMAAPISSNQLVFTLTDGQGNEGSSQGQPISPATDPHLQSDLPDQNKQKEKQAFVKTAGETDIYLDRSVVSPKSALELQAGTIIPGILIQGINSDLPSTLSGRVTENVYDSISGGQVLIPQGSTLTGTYDSQVAYGQERVLVIWQRIIFPNGKSIDLRGMPGVDISGYGGFHDKVDNHYWKITKSVLLVSLLSTGAQLSQPQQTSDNDNGYLSINQQLAQNLGTNISNAGTELFQKDINIQPTLEIRQGYLFNIMITKDIVFDAPYAD